MENTPTVCADELPTILGIVENESKSKSLNICFQSLPAKTLPRQRKWVQLLQSVQRHSGGYIYI